MRDGRGGGEPRPLHAEHLAGRTGASRQSPATYDATRPARFCLVALVGVRVLLEKRGRAFRDPLRFLV